MFRLKKIAFAACRWHLFIFMFSSWPVVGDDIRDTNRVGFNIDDRGIDDMEIDMMIGKCVIGSVIGWRGGLIGSVIGCVIRCVIGCCDKVCDKMCDKMYGRVYEKVYEGIFSYLGSTDFWRSLWPLLGTPASPLPNTCYEQQREFLPAG